MRVAVGGYLTCTNSFATQALGLEQFQRATLTGDVTSCLEPVAAGARLPGSWILPKKITGTLSRFNSFCPALVARLRLMPTNTPKNRFALY